MTPAFQTTNGAFALPLILVLCIADVALAETITLDDGTTCTIIESTHSSAGDNSSGTSSSVTAGGGGVSSSTTINGKTTTMHSAGGSVSSSAGSSATSGNGGSDAFSMSSVTRPDGSIVTRRSDGTCDITMPRK